MHAPVHAAPHNQNVNPVDTPDGKFEFHFMSAGVSDQSKARGDWFASEELDRQVPDRQSSGGFQLFTSLPHFRSGGSLTSASLCENSPVGCWLKRRSRTHKYFTLCLSKRIQRKRMSCITRMAASGPRGRSSEMSASAIGSGSARTGRSCGRGISRKASRSASGSPTTSRARSIK